MRLTVVLTAVLAMAAIATGCGGGGSESLTKAEFVEQADAICKQSSNRIGKEYEAFAKSQAKETGLSPMQWTETGEQILLPNVQAQAEELRELAPPEADADEISRMLDTFDAAVEEGQEDPKSLFSANSPLAEANELAREYGFEVCGLG